MKARKRHVSCHECVENQAYATKCRAAIVEARSALTAEVRRIAAIGGPHATNAFNVLDAALYALGGSIAASFPPKRLKSSAAKASPVTVAQVRTEVERVKFLPAAEAIADKALVRLDHLFGYARSTRICRARRALWLEMRDGGFTSLEIGAMFGRDHSTILAGVAKARREKGDS